MMALHDLSSRGQLRIEEWGLYLQAIGIDKDKSKSWDQVRDPSTMGTEL